MKKKLLYLSLITLLVNACTDNSTEKTITPMNQSLNTAWTKLISQFTEDAQLITNTWQQIQQHYTEDNRAYHKPHTH